MAAGMLGSPSLKIGFYPQNEPVFIPVEEKGTGRCPPMGTGRFLFWKTSGRPFRLCGQGCFVKIGSQENESMDDLGHLIALLGNSLLQNIVRNLFFQRYNSGSGLVTDLGIGHAVKRLQRLFGVHLAM